VILGKPLVSGSCVGGSGMVSVYNWNNGPCMRCVFPNPPPPNLCRSCQDSGVLGPVCGIVGSMSAMEGLKILGEMKGEMSGKLTLVDPLHCEYSSIKVSRKIDCHICSDNPKWTDLSHHTLTPLPVLDILQTHQHILPNEYKKEIVDKEIKHILLDVRPHHEFQICSLPHSINIPIGEIESKIDDIREKSENGLGIYVLCRRGNDSQRVTKQLEEHGIKGVMNIKAGLVGWQELVDNNFPTY